MTTNQAAEMVRSVEKNMDRIRRQLEECITSEKPKDLAEAWGRLLEINKKVKDFLTRPY